MAGSSDRIPSEFMGRARQLMRNLERDAERTLREIDKILGELKRPGRISNRQKMNVRQTLTSLMDRPECFGLADAAKNRKDIDLTVGLWGMAEVQHGGKPNADMLGPIGARLKFDRGGLDFAMHIVLLSFHIHALARWYQRTGIKDDDVILEEMRQVAGCYGAIKLIFFLHYMGKGSEKIWETLSKSKAVVIPSNSGLWLARLRLTTAEAMDGLQLGTDIMTFCDEDILRPNQAEVRNSIHTGLQGDLDNMVNVGLLVDSKAPQTQVNIDVDLLNALVLMFERDDLEPDSKDHITKHIDEVIRNFEKLRLLGNRNSD